MQFTSKKFRDARVVITPKDTVFTPGRPIQKIVGVAAQFKKFQWDSIEAQKTMRWSDDERMLAEATILLSNDFGRRNAQIQGSLWLVPKGATVDVNVDIYDELEAFSPGLRAEVAAKLGLEGNAVPIVEGEGNCAQVIVSEGETRPCRRTATAGRYCSQHDKIQDARSSASDIKQVLEQELASV